MKRGRTSCKGTGLVSGITTAFWIAFDAIRNVFVAITGLEIGCSGLEIGCSAISCSNLENKIHYCKLG